MSRQRDVDHVVETWLEEGVMTLPDRVLDAVLDQLPATPQRRGLLYRVGLSRYRRQASHLVAIAAVVVVLVIVGFGVVGGVTQRIGDRPEPTPSAAFLAGQRALTAGVYLIADPFPVEIEVTAPDGWESYGVYENMAAIKQGVHPEIGLSFWIVGNLPVDGCRPELGVLSPPVGPTIDDLADALAARTEEYVVVEPIATSVDGFEARYLELRGKSPQEGSCATRRTWTIPGSLVAATRDSVAGEVDRLWIVDVDGTRLVVDAFWTPGASTAQRAALDRMVESIDIHPER